LNAFGRLILQNAVAAKLSVVKARLDEAGVRWAIFAGAAAHCYGSTIEVTDIDILIANDDLEKAKSTLKGVDMQGFDFGAGGTIPTPQGACNFFLDEEASARIQRRLFLSVDVPVISVEDNIIFKAILQRGEEEGKHDIEHIRDMVRHERIDLGYLKRRIRQCNAEKRVIPLLRQFISEI
jgi:hypothetical protein